MRLTFAPVRMQSTNGRVGFGNLPVEVTVVAVILVLGVGHCSNVIQAIDRVGLLAHDCLSGALATGAVLASGMFAFYKGKTNMSQQMMRLRVVAQGATVGILVLGSMSAGLDFTAKYEPELLAEDAGKVAERS